VDLTEITAVHGRLLARMRWRLTRPAASPSLRAQIVLMLSVFLLGCVLSALVLVGVWRHTAAEADRSRANEVAAGRVLHATLGRLSAVEAEIASARAAAASARAERAKIADELASLRRVNASAATSLSPRLQAITNEASLMGRETARLESALATLSDYLRHSSGTGVDPNFVAAQVRYLTSASAATLASAIALAEQTKAARASAATLREKR
jgi:hypothetical protein